ncbi:MAG: hypothetical protein KDC23_02625 [Actinobacteria bacterium]|nr:hypothetical protein [Actinomycetota bacterium]
MSDICHTLRFFLDVRDEAVYELYLRPSPSHTEENPWLELACTCGTFSAEGECRHTDYSIIEAENEAPGPDMYLTPIVEEAPEDERRKILGTRNTGPESSRARRSFLSRWGVVTAI